MKKALSILIILLAGFLIYDSKKSYYQNKVDSYGKNLDGIVTEIKKGSGTKVFLNDSNFFYLDHVESVLLRVGDSISTKNAEILVFEKNKNNGFTYLTTINVKKPKDSYHEFFFGI